jgi:hypothetical protein
MQIIACCVPEVVWESVCVAWCCGGRVLILLDSMNGSMICEDTWLYLFHLNEQCEKQEKFSSKSHDLRKYDIWLVFVCYQLLHCLLFIDTWSHVFLKKKTNLILYKKKSNLLIIIQNKFYPIYLLVRNIFFLTEFDKSKKIGNKLFFLPFFSSNHVANLYRCI